MVIERVVEGHPRTEISQRHLRKIEGEQVQGCVASIRGPDACVPQRALLQ